VTPLQLSPHDDRVLYTGAQKVLRSGDRGDTWREISPDLTTNDAAKIDGEGHVQYCAITTLAESPLRAGLLWVGTDDGRLWWSGDFGGSWRERSAELARAGAPPGTWISRVVPSHHDERRAYVSLSGYTRDDFAPHVFRTDDGGATWASIARGLPESPVNVLVEDRRNPDLLFVGNDHGVWLTLDGGAQWTQLRSNLPPVPVKDLLVHPRDNDLIIGSYGRGAWVGDVHALQELRPEVRARRAHLFSVEPRPVQLTERGGWGDDRLYGDRALVTPNRPDGLEVFYWLREPAKEVKVVFRRPGADGEVLAERAGAAGPGLQRVAWRTRLGTPSKPEEGSRTVDRAKEESQTGTRSAAAADSETGGDRETEASEAPPEGRDRADPALPGEVEVVLVVDGERFVGRSRLREMPAMPVPP
jgi:hypothetical protein